MTVMAKFNVEAKFAQESITICRPISGWQRPSPTQTKALNKCGLEASYTCVKIENPGNELKIHKSAAHSLLVPMSVPAFEKSYRAAYKDGGILQMPENTILSV
ncbi:MAG: hypothetical protein K9G62_04130 [Alphaproteobacteria bacterium]|nr:hypothetical protein [Alphaproteobacteria bacterium]